MKLQKCKNGHFYDEDKHKTCPQCNSLDNNLDRTMPVTEGQTTPDVGVTVPTSPVFDGPTKSSEDTTTTVGIEHVNKQGEDGLTRGPWDSVIIPGDKGGNGGNNGNNGNSGNSGNSQAAAASRFGPTVGWLVCIEGPHLGEDFKLMAGINTIGRDKASNSIVLAKDEQVTRSTEGVVAYDLKSNRYFAARGEKSSQLCYVNDEPLLTTVLLKKNDILLLGTTKLVFVPFCDDTFKWSDVLNKGKPAQ